MLDILVSGFSLLFLILTGTILYHMIKLRIALGTLKIKLSKNKLATTMIYKKLQQTDNTIESILHTLSSFEQQFTLLTSLSMGSSHNKIEHQYQRAKKILQQSGSDNQNILTSCDMTEEEIELLTDLMQS